MDDVDCQALIARDGRLLELLGRALRSSEDFAEEESGETALPEPVDEEPEFHEIMLPPISLTLRVRPYAHHDEHGQLVVHYAANILTGEEPNLEARPPGMEGQPLTPLDLHVHADATALQNAAGKLSIRYDTVAEQAVLTRAYEGNGGTETSPTQPDLLLRRAPHPWVHRVHASDVQETAASVLSAPAHERSEQLATLVRTLTEEATSQSAPPPVSSPGPPDIWVVGLGTKAGVQITDETRDVLRSVQEVLFVDTGVGTRELLESLCPRVNSLFAKSYTETDARLNAYQHMALSVVEAALAHGPVAFAMQGHPVVGGYAPLLIHDLAISLGLRVRILPGLSHLDALFAELLLDPFVQGLQAYEATDLLLRRRPLRPDVPALLFQVGNVETRLHTARISRPERMHRLREHLERFYPPDHRVQAVFASPHPLAPSSGYTFALSHLGDYAHVIHPGVTLFIPPVVERPISDPILAKLVDSPSHLHSITV